MALKSQCVGIGFDVLINIHSTRLMYVSLVRVAGFEIFRLSCRQQMLDKDEDAIVSPFASQLCSSSYHCTMKASLFPSVVVVRSMCLPSADSQEHSEEIHAHADAMNEDAASILQRSLQSLPVTCDITVLPEIPADLTHGNDRSDDVTRNQDEQQDSTFKRNDIRMERQALHPCGMDNVLLLRELPPAADPAAYLLSLSSCEMLVTQIETPNGVVMVDPMKVSVQATPSTFSFAFENASSRPESPGNNGIVVNPRSASAELNVVFDFSVAISRLEEALKGKYDALTKVQANEENNPSLREYDARPLSLEEMKASCSDKSSNAQAVHRDAHHHDELVHVVRQLAEKEALHLDYMLAALGLVFLLLLVHYVRTVLPVLRAKRSLSAFSKKRNKSLVGRTQSLASETIALADQTIPENMRKGELPRLCIIEKRCGGAILSRSNHEMRLVAASNRPPVNSVSFHRSGASANDAPLLLQESQETYPTDKGIASPSSKSPFVASESTIGMAETSSLSSASARERFTFLPMNYSPPEATKVEEKEKKILEANNGQDEHQLSPCSKLARRWIETKGKRRVCRKDNGRTHAVISPVVDVLSSKLVTEETPNNVQPYAVGCLEIPRLSCGPNKLIRDFIADREVSLRPVYFRDEKVSTPETCLVSDESFLQDYWGK